MNVWEFIINKNESAIKVVLLCVLESDGSSPGRQGFKMAVAADGDFFGTIGGGIMEHKFVEMARAQLATMATAADIYRQVHDKLAAKNQSGMICSGEQTILVYHIRENDLPAIRLMKLSIENLKNGELQINKNGISFSEDPVVADFYFEQQADNFLYKEKTGFKNKLYIIGGGHCALALSKLMSEMDFHITLYDERANLNTLEQNIFVHEKVIVSSYAELSTLLDEGENVYVVIMTVGYRSDAEAVKALLNKNFRYVGMLGSRKKMEQMFKDFKLEKLYARAFDEVHTPIGIKINSQTAAEIAVSIAAEIISVKNRN